MFWPGEFHGLCSPWGCKESDRPEQLSLSPIMEETRVNMKIREWGPMSNSIFFVSLWVVLFCGNHAQEILWEDVYLESISGVTGNLHFSSHFKTKSTYLFWGGKRRQTSQASSCYRRSQCPGSSSSYLSGVPSDFCRHLSSLCLRCCSLFFLILTCLFSPLGCSQLL